MAVWSGVENRDGTVPEGQFVFVGRRKEAREGVVIGDGSPKFFGCGETAALQRPISVCWTPRTGKILKRAGGVARAGGQGPVDAGYGVNCGPGSKVSCVLNSGSLPRQTFQEIPSLARFCTRSSAISSTAFVGSLKGVGDRIGSIGRVGRYQVPSSNTTALLESRHQGPPPT